MKPVNLKLNNRLVNHKVKEYLFSINYKKYQIGKIHYVLIKKIHKLKHI